MTLRFGDSHRTPVYSKDSADEIGQVIRYVVAADTGRVTAVQVAGRKRKALLVDWSGIVGFGPDAVVIASGDALRHPEGDHEQRVTAGDLDLHGRRVLTDAGVEVGEVTDVEFDESSGVVEVLHTTRTTVAADGLLAIGPYAVMVRHDAVRSGDALDED